MTPAGTRFDELLRPDRVGPRIAAATGVLAWTDFTAELIAGGKSNLTFTLTSTDGELILRRPPTGKLLPSAHDMAREARIQTGLTGTGVPVATILLTEPSGADLGVPYYVMEKVVGHVVRDTLPRGTPPPTPTSQHGHSEIVFSGVRVPAENLLGGVGDGFAIAQARLGPGRIHHAMRAIGMAERALALMVDRAKSRTAFGKLLSEQGVVQAHIANSRIEIDQARLQVLHCAWMIDDHGAKDARFEISAIKVIAPQVACTVIDRAIEIFGAARISDDVPLASFYAWARALRIVDGPDAVHRRTIAKGELRRTPPFVG
ncbi:hypothetical protein CGZ93_05815 [Enemella dayhoffiae]|uniref:Acyl-CoA dehydrogenase n=1 Tax=Enemella dayhoffiae TaxID=2016507 RepID=A0A255H722_9ACTN|nr:acyl-CoA dehydrogenase family protein [Enemella dayhoffiae]OYO23458.1 hypothetical protein CGZ93_05815 [Enemella dayhoffiae]